MDFHVGDRVRISGRHYLWAKGATGIIQAPPESVQDLVADCCPWEGDCRFVKGRRGFIEFYWVEFDEPQTHANGDGPYSEAEIPADVLEPIEDDSEGETGDRAH